jgi:hypothetical protein
MKKARLKNVIFIIFLYVIALFLSWLSYPSRERGAIILLIGTLIVFILTGLWACYALMALTGKKKNTISIGMGLPCLCYIMGYWYIILKSLML